jgi:dihydrolipoamide dehydrogenase
MKFDVLIIGGGPGGTETARILARAGKKVGLIEYREIGGTCLNRGCIPAKTMLFSAEMFRLGKKIRNYGIRFCEDTPHYDFDGMVAKRQEIMEKLRKGLTFLCKKDGVELIEGKAEVVSDNQVLVNGTDTYEADYIVLATGGGARKFPGYIDTDERFLISDNIFELKAFPESIVIVGGGPVGTEFATFFNTFGVKVSIVDMSPVMLTYYDHDLGKELAKSFNRDGIDVYTETQITHIDTSNPKLAFSLSNGVTLEADKVLSAIGVVPTVEYLAKSNVKVSEKGRVETNEHMQTSVSNIYALGDAVGKSGSAYGAEREGCYIAHHILGDGFENYNLDYVHFPDVVFTDPEVATCGYSEQDLVAAGTEFKVMKAFFLANGKAVIKGDTRGFCKILVDAKTDVVLGVHIIGPQATEIIHTVPIALDMKLTAKQWRRYVWGHPVLAEIVKEALHS